MRKDPKKILQEFDRAQRDTRSNYEIAVRGLVDTNDRERTGGGGLLEDVYNLEIGHPELMDQSLHWSIRASMARHIAQQVYHKINIEVPYSKKAEITQGKTAENITELLKNPEKYGLTPEQEEQLLDAAWFIHGGDEKLNPEIAEGMIKAERSSSALASIRGKNQNIDSVSSQYGRARKKIENNNEFTPDEIRAARKKQTLSYFESLSADDRKKSSNTDYNLRALEMDIAYLRSHNQYLNAETKSFTMQSITSGVSMSGQMIATGDGNLLFKAGGDIAANKLKQYALKKFSGKEIATKVATQMVLNAVLPGAGAALSKVLGPLIEKYIGKAIDEAYEKAKKGLKRAGKAAVGISAFLAGQAIGAGMAAAVAGILTVVVLPVVIALILFIINSGAYIVPPSDTDGSGFIPIPEGPGECPEGPAGWPVDTTKGVAYAVSQGPFTNSSHYGREAIDIINGSPALNMNAIVIATHPGKVRSAGVDSYGGKFVDIEGECNGVKFRSRHVHFFFINSGITAGVTVNRGQVLGIMGNTGYSQKNSKHDHYEFRALESFGGGPFANSPIPMSPPYIPKPVTRGCGDGVAPPCGVPVP